MNAMIASDAALERAPAVGPTPSSAPAVSSAGVAASAGPFVALLQMLVGNKGTMTDGPIDAVAPANADPVPPRDDDTRANEHAAIPTSFVPISAYTPPPAMGDATVGRDTPGGGEAGTTAAGQRDSESPAVDARTGSINVTPPRTASTAPAPAAGAVFAAGPSVDWARAAPPNAAPQSPRAVEPLRELPRALEARSVPGENVDQRADEGHDANAAELEASKRVVPEPERAEPRIDIEIATARRAASWSAAGPVESTAPQAPHDVLVSDTAPAPAPDAGAVFAAGPSVDRARAALPNPAAQSPRAAEPVRELPRVLEARSVPGASVDQRTDGRHDAAPNAAELDASRRVVPEPGRAEARIEVAIATARRAAWWSAAGPVDTAVDTPIDRPRSTEYRVVDGGQQVSDTPSRTIAAAAPQAPHDLVVSDTAPTERSMPRRTVAEQIVGQVASVRHEGRQSMSLRLDPPELGAVRIDAVLDGRHVSLEIRTEHAEARALVEGSLPAIRQALEDRGFVADQLSVQLGMDTATGSADRDAERFAHPASPPHSERQRMIAPRRRVAREPVEGLDLLV